MKDAVIQYQGQHIPERGARYPSIKDQLDKLWHDIDAGFFGDTAKGGTFYQAIKAVKNEFPKGGSQ